MNKRTFTLLGTGVALVLFFGVNILANAGLRSVRFDLTEEKLFSLSDGAKRIARNLDEPVRLYFYYSEEPAAEAGLAAYGNRVREILEEFELASDGNLILERINPELFSEEEDRAVQEGLYGVPVGSEKLFFGLVATNSTDDREVIAFFDTRNERFLEYDIARLIHSLANPDRQKVGVLSSLPLEGAPGNPMMGQQGTPPWQVLAQLQSLFDVETLDPSAGEIPDDLEVLVIIHPRNFAEATLYAIDQYVLAGGKAIVYVDPHCESDQSQTDPNNPMASMGASRASDFGPLLEAWGVELVPNKVVADRGYALPVMTGSQTNPEQWDFVVWLALQSEAFDQEDAITSLLQNVNVATAGVLRPLPDASTDFHPLMQSSEDSMQLDVGMVQFMPDPKRLLNNFVAEHEKLTVAARISGELESAYPEGDPGEPSTPEGEDPEEVQATGTDHLAQSSQPANIIVVSDADMLQDRFWIREERFGPLSLGFRKTADNGDFLFNAVENLVGGADLISIRAQGKFSRPFTKVEEIRKDAEQQYLAREQELERRLNDIQTRINDLQTEKSAESALILSPEQLEQLEVARTEQVETRKELREVKHSLRKDIEQLGTWIKLINIVLIPLVVALFAVLMGVIRVKKRAVA